MDISKDRIRIRNSVITDCGQLAEWWNDGKVMAHAGFPNGLGITLDKIKRQILQESDENGRTLIIEYDNMPIGEMNYRNIQDYKVEIGIKICNPNYHEKGLGRVILSLFIKELFIMGFKVIILDTNVKNKRAQHIYELLGFKKIRINSDSWKDQLGNLQSSIDYKLIEDNFNDYS